VLTARNADGKVHTRTLPVSITDPNSAINDLTGTSSKVWKLSRFADEREFPLLVSNQDTYEAALDNNWWAFDDENEPFGSRLCLMEERYIFHMDGKFSYETDGLVFADYGIWVEEGSCIDETDANLMKNTDGEDLRAWGSGEHTFEFDAAAGTLTLNGLGAHIGLPKVGTNGEVRSPQPNITYQVLKIDTEGPIDKMLLRTQFPAGTETGNWYFNLVSYEDSTLEPSLSDPTPNANFEFTIDGNTVSFTNGSNFADSYMWDFGDGNTSTEESPTHTYTDDGSYDIVLTATNAAGNSIASETIIIAINSSFSANTLFGEESKSWKLAPIAGAFKVGNGIGGDNFWSSTAEDVTARSCAFDDTYTFNKEGVFEYNANGDVWGEAYMGVDPPGCIAENEVGADAKAWTSGTHSYTLTETSGEELASLTVTGTGAFIALPKAFNGGEYSEEKEAPPTADGSVTYEVVQYANDGSAELLVLTIFIRENIDGPVYWTFTLVAE